jgi:hypothetical protein
MTTFIQALRYIDEEAPIRIPCIMPTDRLNPRYPQELREHVDGMIINAFNQGHARGLWDAAVIARQALEDAS